MPARNPSPRRASSRPPSANRGAPKGAGRPQSAAWCRAPAPRPRGAQLRATRTARRRRAAHRPRQARRSPRTAVGARANEPSDAKPYGERPRRYDRDDRDAKDADRRPRPSSAGRDARADRPSGVARRPRSLPTTRPHLGRPLWSLRDSSVACRLAPSDRRPARRSARRDRAPTALRRELS